MQGMSGGGGGTGPTQSQRADTKPAVSKAKLYLRALTLYHQQTVSQHLLLTHRIYELGNHYPLGPGTLAKAFYKMC